MVGLFAVDHHTGLRRYGAARLANRIKWTWIRHNMDVYKKSGKLVEKYNVVEGLEGSGGEYPNQDGFGWTNGVLLKLLTEHVFPLPGPLLALDLRFAL